MIIVILAWLLALSLCANVTLYCLLQKAWDRWEHQIEAENKLIEMRKKAQAEMRAAPPSKGKGEK